MESHSKLNGDCEILMKNGSVYRGSFEEDLLEGNGFIEAPLFIYKGSVKSSLPEGSGLMIYKTLNAEYEGEFIQGVINRKGIYKIDNQMLKGEFIHGKLIGKGEKLIGTSSRYVGEFTDSLMHGKGVLRFNSEKFKGIYNGDFRLNKLHGQGKMKIDNFEYRGEFAHGEIHGNGEIYLEDMVFKGGFFKGDVQGKGNIHFFDGSHYEGEWNYGKPNGSGEACDSYGYWIASNFIDGRPAARHRLRHDYFANLEKFRTQVQEFLDKLEWVLQNVSGTVDYF